MKAIVYTEYGSPDVLHLAEVAKPAPKDNEVLIRVHATPVSFGDLLARNFKSVTPHKFNMPMFFWLPARLAFGWQKPKKNILGSEFAGEVEAIGKAVTRFKPGDQVFGYRGQNMGAYAEYVCLPEDGVLTIKPANLSYEEAAALPYGAFNALNLLKKANVQPGQKILINGASGGIGSTTVQLAKSHFGAHVTGVCSTPRMEYVKSLGADKVINYTREDFTRNGETYDVIIDILGKSSFGRCKKSLKPNGRQVFVSFKTRQLLQMVWTSMRGGQKVICGLLPEKAEDLRTAAELIEAGKIKAFIDKRYPLAQAAEAHRYSEAGQKQGSVVITVGQS